MTNLRCNGAVMCVVRYCNIRRALGNYVKGFARVAAEADRRPCSCENIKRKSILCVLCFQRFKSVPELIEFYHQYALDLNRKEKVVGCTKLINSPNK